MSVWLVIVAVVALIAVAAFLGAAEVAVTRTGVVRALRLNEEGRPGAAQLLWLAEHPARGLNALLLLTIVSRVTAAALVTAVALDAGRGATAAALAGLVLASFVLAEVVPRSFTLRHLDRVGPVLAPLVAAMARSLRPLVRVLVALGGLLGGRSRSVLSSDEELRRLMQPDEGDEDITIEDDERQMIHSIFELGDTVVRALMVPRPDMVTVSADASLGTVVDTIVEKGYSRLPVWREDRDRIVGVVYAKDVLQRLARGRSDVSWEELIRDPTFVPESKRADDLLRELQRSRVHLALVVDEHGAVTGLVTIEDILEEIVGEIVDEHDHEEPAIVHLDDGGLRVSARVTVHDLNELLDAELPEDEDWDSVGGLVIGLLGRMPQAGDAVQVEGYTLVAERVQGHRVDKVRIELPVEVSESAGGGA